MYRFTVGFDFVDVDHVVFKCPCRYEKWDDIQYIYTT